MNITDYATLSILIAAVVVCAGLAFRGAGFE